MQRAASAGGISHIDRPWPPVADSILEEVRLSVRHEERVAEEASNEEYP